MRTNSDRKVIMQLGQIQLEYMESGNVVVTSANEAADPEMLADIAQQAQSFAETVQPLPFYDPDPVYTRGMELARHLNATVISIPAPVPDDGKVY